MSDPTYEKELIKKNPVWHMAWIISEWRNDNAPLGWGTYIPIAESINEHVIVPLVEGEKE